MKRSPGVVSTDGWWEDVNGVGLAPRLRQVHGQIVHDAWRIGPGASCRGLREMLCVKFRENASVALYSGFLSQDLHRSTRREPVDGGASTRLRIKRHSCCCTREDCLDFDTLSTASHLQRGSAPILQAILSDEGTPLEVVPQSTQLRLHIVSASHMHPPQAEDVPHFVHHNALQAFSHQDLSRKLGGNRCFCSKPPQSPHYRMQRLMTHDSRDSAPTSKPERILLAASPNNPLHLELQCGQRLPCREQQRPSVNTMSWHLHRAHLSRLSRDGHHLSPLPPVHIPSLGSLARLADVARDLRVPRLLCMPRCLDRFVRRKPKKTTSESLDVF